MTSQMNTITQRNTLRARVRGTEIVLKSADRRLNLTYLLPVQGLNHGHLTVLI